MEEEDRSYLIALGVITLASVLVLVVGYLLGSVVIEVIGWIGVGIVVINVLFLGYIFLDDLLS